MNRKALCIAAVLLVLCLAGCGSSGSQSTSIIGKDAATAPYVFVKGINPPGFVPLIGYDISTFNPANRTYYLASSAPTTGILAFNINSVLGGGATSLTNIAPNLFVGNIHTGIPGTPGAQTQFVDPNSDFAGGPNGVTVVKNGVRDFGAGSVDNYEIWAGDANSYNGGSNVYPGESNVIAQNDCNSSVKVVNLVNGATTAEVVHINGCEPTDYVTLDPDHQIVLATNPDENPSQSFANADSNNPKGPFVTLIDVSTRAILARIAFDGTNSTPNGSMGSPVYSHATGLFYVPVETDNNDSAGGGAIAIINPVQRKAVGVIKLAHCNPGNMALGPDGQEVFLGCSSNLGPPAVVSVVDSGSIHKGDTLKSFPEAVPAPTDSMSLASYFGPSCDQISYAPGLNFYLAACQFSSNNSLVAVIDAGTGLDASTIKFRQAIATDPHGAYANHAGAAHSVTADPVTGAILVPLPMGDPMCPTYASTDNVGVGCLGVWAPKGSMLANGSY